MKNQNHKRKCPRCGIELFYTSKNIYRAIKSNSLCRSCSKKGHLNPSFGNVCKNKEQLKTMMVGNKYNLGKYRTEEQKKIHSEKMKAFCRTDAGRECVKKRNESIRKTRKLIGTNGFHPNFNKTACKFFDYLNCETGWKGKHAMNGGEHYIPELGYWVDYYVPEKNIVIEWDENKEWHFKKGNRINEDVSRENKIREHLKCKFIRVLHQKNVDHEKIKNYIFGMLSQ